MQFILEFGLKKLDNSQPSINTLRDLPIKYDIVVMRTDYPNYANDAYLADPPLMTVTAEYRGADPSIGLAYGKSKHIPTTEAGYLWDSYGKPVTLPIYDEHGVGLTYRIQEHGKKDWEHFRWQSYMTTPTGAFANKNGEWIYQYHEDETLMELVSSEFRSKWITISPEADRPSVKAHTIAKDKDGEDIDTNVFLLKNSDDFIRIRGMEGSEYWFHNFKENEGTDEWGLLDDDLRSDLRVSLPDATDGYIESNGHRYKASIAYDTYDGALATFQEEYPVTFHAQGGTFDGDADTQVTRVLHGKKISAASIPTPKRPGYIFVEWAVGPQSTDAAFNPDTVIEKALDLYAVWEPKDLVTTEEPKVEGTGDALIPDTDYVKVTFAGNAGTLTGDRQSIDYWIIKNTTISQAAAFQNKAGVKPFAIPTATREHYDLLGWERQRRNRQLISSRIFLTMKQLYPRISPSMQSTKSIRKTRLDTPSRAGMPQAIRLNHCPTIFRTCFQQMMHSTT